MYLASCMSVNFNLAKSKLNSIEFHIKFYRASKIMKFVPKFQLGFSLSWQTPFTDCS
jgi:hypothetical protein